MQSRPCRLMQPTHYCAPAAQPPADPAMPAVPAHPGLSMASWGITSARVPLPVMDATTRLPLGLLLLLYPPLPAGLMSAPLAVG